MVLRSSNVKTFERSRMELTRVEWFRRRLNHFLAHLRSVTRFFHAAWLAGRFTYENNVELTRVELVASCMPCKRSTN